MAYHTTPYLLLFLPAALLFYQITPAKWRSYTLLIFSYLFFWSFSEKLIIYLIGTTFLTHHICIWMDTMDKRDKRKKRVLQLGIFLLLGTILYLKYRNFFFGKFRSWQGASYRLELSRSTDLFTNWNFFLYTICNRIYGRCVLGKGKGRVQSGEDRIVSWILPGNRRRSDLQMGRCGRYVV